MQGDYFRILFHRFPDSVVPENPVSAKLKFFLSGLDIIFKSRCPQINGNQRKYK